MIGYFGEEDEELANPVPIPLTVFIDRSHAQEIATRRVLLVEFDPQKLLNLDSSEKFYDIWKESGSLKYCQWMKDCDPPQGWYNPRTTNFFLRWAADKEYDSVLIPAPAFDGDLASRTFFVPSCVILDPEIVREITDLTGLFL